MRGNIPADAPLSLFLSPCVSLTETQVDVWRVQMCSRAHPRARAERGNIFVCLSGETNAKCGCDCLPFDNCTL